MITAKALTELTGATQTSSASAPTPSSGFREDKIINDSDPDIGHYGLRRNQLWFGSTVVSLAPRNDNRLVNNDNACTGQEYSLNREVYIENAPNTLTISVIGKEYDSDFPSLGSQIHSSK